VLNWKLRTGSVSALAQPSPYDRPELQLRARLEHGQDTAHAVDGERLLMRCRFTMIGNR